MRRLPILLAIALVFALVALAPVSAGKWTCDDRPDHPSCQRQDPPTCAFNPEGVLINWDRTSPFQCLWLPEVANTTFSFQLVSPNDDVSKVMLPHLIVNEDDDFPSTICFNEWAKSPQKLPFPLEVEGDSLWTFNPTQNCSDDGNYLMTVSVKPDKTGTVDFVMTSPTSS
jgi:hypothetical protein